MPDKALARLRLALRGLSGGEAGGEASPQAETPRLTPSIAEPDPVASVSASDAASSAEQEAIPSGLTGNINMDVGLRDAALAGWFNRDKSELCEGFPIGPDDVVADIGCGDGGNAQFCARLGARMILADIDAEALETARRRVAEVSMHPIDAHVTDADPLPIADGAATRVVSMEVLEHVADPARFMAELVRIGRPGALYLLACPDPASEALQRKVAPESYFRHPNHIRVIAHDEFEALAAGAGLRIEARAAHGFFRSVWLALFWECKTDLKSADHPLLTSWAKTWSRMLDLPEGPKLKRAFDEILPKSQVIIARKPG